MTAGVALLVDDSARRPPGQGPGRPAARGAPGPSADLPGTSRVVTALPASSRALLRARMPRVEMIPLEEHRAGESAVACLVDPAFLEEAAPGGAWIGAIPEGLPLVVWADLSPRGMEGVLAAEPLRPVRLLIDGVDDVPGTLARLLPTIPRLVHGHRLEEALRPRLEQAPAPIRAACARVIERPESFFDATDLARAAQMSRRHLDRILARCGFAPGKAMVVGARVWRAHHGIVTEGRSVPNAAQALGYADSKALLRHIRVVTGEGAAGFRGLEATQCMERVIGHLEPV